MSTLYNATLAVATTIQNVSLEGGGVVFALPSKLIVAAGNTNILSVVGLFDTIQGAYWTTNASLTGTLFDQFGNIITTINMVYASGSNGNFVGVFGGITFSPAMGRGYTILLQGISDWSHSFSLPMLAEVVATPLIPGLSGG